MKISSLGSSSPVTAHKDLLREKHRKEVGSGENGPRAVIANSAPRQSAKVGQIAFTERRDFAFVRPTSHLKTRAQVRRGAASG